MPRVRSRPGISAITLLSYDYRFLTSSISRYLPYVDEVLVGVDREGLTWSGEQFSIPDAFFETLRSLDGGSKIRLVSRSFYSPSRSPMENDVAERNALSLEAAEGNWIVSIDADEYLLNPAQFFRFLWRFRDSEKVCVEGSWLTVFKDLEHSLLVVGAAADGSLERFPLATRERGAFVAARRTEAPPILSPALALHYSWGREKGELLQKLLNWSHSRDFDVRKYFEFWLGVNEENHAAIRDFHPVRPDTWSKLVSVRKADVENWRRWDLGQKARLSVFREAGGLWRTGIRRWRSGRTLDTP